MAGPVIPNPEPELPQQGIGYQAPNLADILKQSHAATASKLAVWVVGILAASIALHYGCVLLLIFQNRNDGIPVLSDIFHAWLPVLAGLTGAAATYYFTKDK